MRPEIATRFWAKVQPLDPDVCWEWQACRGELGYGRLLVPGIGVRGAHRISYEINKGPIPTGMLVLHSCDNPPCVNPAHLFLGTWRDNVRDMMDKGRRFPTTGENNGRSKLSEEAVREIRRLWDFGGVTKTALGKAFGVSRPVIADIVSRSTWRTT